MNRRGVTLFEVATSTLSISMVLALMLPALNEARRQAKDVHCLANLTRIAEASATYATANRQELAIPVHPLIGQIEGATGAYEWGGKSGLGEPVLGTSEWNSKWGTQYGRGPASRPLNKIVYGDVFTDHYNDPGQNQTNWLSDTQLDLDVFRCPADFGYSGHHYEAWRDSALTSYDHYGTSYAANLSWVGVSGGDCKLESNSPFLRPISRVPNPANTLLFLENPGRFAWRKSYGNDGCSFLNGGALDSDVESPIRGWHGAIWRFNTAYVDGHVQTIRMEGHEVPQRDIGRYPRFFIHETDYSFWHCVIIRGSNWQLDTLPAPPVRTNMSCPIDVVNPIG